MQVLFAVGKFSLVASAKFLHMPPKGTWIHGLDKAVHFLCTGLHFSDLSVC
jgi:hypothetical protein